jgi:predicted TIM-barrel fold metal-dependent hydrolase
MNDSHCHFFSTQFFTTLSKQRGKGETVAQLCGELQWEDPGGPEALADRWIRELDANGVRRSALIASVPGDEASVAAAIARYPDRLVGFFMLDPSASDAVDRTRRAITELGLRVRSVCFPP